jgi:hypothetical protein
VPPDVVSERVLPSQITPVAGLIEPLGVVPALTRTSFVLLLQVPFITSALYLPGVVAE